MVRLNFESFEEQYAIVRQSACGGMACSVLVLVALEVLICNIFIFVMVFVVKLY